MLVIQTDFWYIEQLRFSQASHNLIASGAKRTGTDNRPKMVKEYDPRASSLEPELWLEFPTTSLIALNPTGQHGAVCKRQFSDDYIYFFRWQSRKPLIGNHSISVAASELEAIALYESEVEAAGLINDRRVVPAHRSIYVRIWNIDSESCVRHFATFPGAGQLIYSPNGRYLAQAANDGSQLELTRIEDLVTISLVSADAFRMAFSPQSTYLASSGQFTQCWQVDSGSLIARFRGQDEDVPDLAFSPDERFLAIARTDGPVEFWDFHMPRLVRSYHWNIGRLSAIALAPDGLTCAAAGENGRIVIWDLDDL